VTRLTRLGPLPRVGPIRDVSSITKPRHGRTVAAAGSGKPRIAIVSNYRARSSSGRSPWIGRNRVRRPTCPWDAGAAGNARATRTIGPAPAAPPLNSTFRRRRGATARLPEGQTERVPAHSRAARSRHAARPTTSKFFVRTHDFSTLTVLTSYAADHAVGMARARGMAMLPGRDGDSTAARNR
jgi:hypothetical protein